MDMQEQDEIFKQAAALPSSIDPERDLWPSIAAELGHQRSDFWQWRVAASGLAASLLIGLLLVPPIDEPPVARVQSVPMLSAELVRHAPFDAAFLRDYRRGLEALDEQLEALPPGTREVVIGNLNIVRASIRDINEAIDKDPNNVQLRQLLQLTYRQEMEILSMVRDSAVNVEQSRTTT